jgi:DNA-directed RNA polymerase specialized sigma24 family protein
MKTTMTTTTSDPPSASLEAIPDLETPDRSNDNTTLVATVDTSHFLHDPCLIRYTARILLRYGVGQQDMPDVLGDVQADALEAARAGAMPTNLWEWRALVATIAYRTAIDRLRHAEVRDRYDAGLCEDPDVYMQPTLQWEHRDPVDTKRFLAVLEDLFDSGQMPEDGAHILQDEADHVPQAETAAELGITEATVKSRLFRMRDRFHARLATLGMLTLTLMFLALLQAPFLGVVLPTHNVAAPAPRSTPANHATELRNAGLKACEAAAWSECLTKLDGARALDPDGDHVPAVRDARAQAEGALHDRAFDGRSP